MKNKMVLSFIGPGISYNKAFLSVLAFLTHEALF